MAQSGVGVYVKKCLLKKVNIEHGVGVRLIFVSAPGSYI